MDNLLENKDWNSITAILRDHLGEGDTRTLLVLGPVIDEE
jgi:hypothetical protein